MNSAGYFILGISLSVLLFLLVLPYIVLGFWWGILVTIISYFWFNFLAWIVCDGEISYLKIMIIPFERLLEWIKTIKK